MEKMNQIWRNPINQYSIENVFRTINAHLDDVNVIVLPHASRGIQSVLRNIRYVARMKLDRIHVVGDVHYILLVPAKYKILTIHDLYSLGPRTGLRGFMKWALWFYLPTLLADEIVTISNVSKSAISKRLLSKREVKVISNPITADLGEELIDKVYNYKKILVIGTKANKNVDYIFDELQYLDVDITVVGALRPEVIEKHACRPIKLINHRNISSKEIAQLYKDNTVYISASMNEGFGLPILEAQSHGLIVLASSMEIYREVGGESILYFDPKVKGDLLQLYCNLVANELVVDQDAYHKNLSRFSSQKIAEQYKNLYDQ